MEPDAQFKKVIQLIAEDDLAQAESECRKALGLDTHDINMAALLGAILLKGNRLDEAESILVDVVTMAPTFAKPHQDLAVLYANREDFQSAVKYFQRATEIDPKLASAFAGLSRTLDILGNERAAAEALERYLELTPDDLLARAMALHQKGDLKKARLECGRLLAQEPENLAAMRRLAMISVEEGQTFEAERMLRRMNQLIPESIVPLMDLANLHYQQHNYVAAVGWLQSALKMAPDNGEAHFMLAQSRLIVGKAEEALTGYSTCLTLNKHDTRAMLGRGNALRALGRGDEAISVYRQCIHEKGIFADACWSLASMRTYEFSDDELIRMIRQLEEQGNNSYVATRLDFAIGKALDDRAEYGAAWAHYLSGNARQRDETRYDGAAFESSIDTVIGIYSEEVSVTAPVSEPGDAIPIFVVGMPRSGSTLLEQILASHPLVEATAELPYLREIATALNGPQNTPGSLHLLDLGEDSLRALGQKYLAATMVHRPEKKPYFIDKLPANFPYVGFIHLVLPQAIVIDARRQPLDTCVANFRQLFAQGKEFSYELVELSEMYLQYMRMMEHWNAVLPGKVLTVHYEKIIEETEQQIRRIVRHCGLEWDDACLDFEFTRRTFSTASSEQVQQPIYRSSIGYWRHYEAYLAELVENLDSVLETIVRQDQD